MDEQENARPKERTRCEGCGSFFYAGEDDEFSEKFYCSFCQPYLRWCISCSAFYKTSLITKKQDEGGICYQCRDEYKMNGGNAFVNGWMVLRFLVLARDEFTCRYCGRTPLEDKVKLECDHIIPRNKGGKDERDNLITACEDCNRGKTDVLLERSLRTKLQQRKMKER